MRCGRGRRYVVHGRRHQRRGRAEQNEDARRKGPVRRGVRAWSTYKVSVRSARLDLESIERSITRNAHCVDSKTGRFFGSRVAPKGRKGVTGGGVACRVTGHGEYLRVLHGVYYTYIQRFTNLGLPLMPGEGQGRERDAFFSSSWGGREQPVQRVPLRSLIPVEGEVAPPKGL